ncbi:MAG: hypothetical protein IT260_06715 [Saprospiraceae bacterium]|nr:hypothetical protein [Saprospiraceae bacterium]
MRTLILFLCSLPAWCLPAQTPDSLPAPSLDTLTPTAASATAEVPRKPGLVRRILTKDYPNPRTAAFLSLALPGAGQIYNRKYWKLPLVYGGLGALTYFEIQNVRQYRELRDNYKWVVDDDDNTNPTKEPYTFLDATSLKRYRDEWRRYMELTSLFLGLGYVLTATEAFVDAHLMRFDVSDDLSLRLLPKAQIMPDAALAFGIGLRLELRHYRPKPPPLYAPPASAWSSPP